MRISDWSSDVCSSDLAAVRDGEGAAGHVVHRQRALLGALAEVGDRLFDSGEGQAFGIADDRHDEAVGRADRDRNVEIVVIDDLVAVDAAVYRRNAARRARTDRKTVR